MNDHGVNGRVGGGKNSPDEHEHFGIRDES